MAVWKFITLRAAKAYGADHCSSFAAAIAYYALLSLFPLAVFAVSLGGYFLRHDPGAQERMINALLENLPLDNASGQQQLHDALSAVTKGRAGLGLLGLAGTAYSASALFGAVRTGMNAVFHASRPRPLMQAKLIDLGMVAGLGVLLLSSLVLTAAIAIFNDTLRGWTGDVPLFSRAVTLLIDLAVPGAIMAVVFGVVFRVTPHAEVRWRDVVPGAVLCAVAFEVVKAGFSLYVANFGNYDAVYGTLGFVIVFLFFAYISAQIVLFGAEFTKATIEVKSGAAPAAAPAVPRAAVSLPRRVEMMIKGLFVTEDAHHEASLPYEPATDTGSLTDRQADRRRR